MSLNMSTRTSWSNKPPLLPLAQRRGGFPRAAGGALDQRDPGGIVYVMGSRVGLVIEFFRVIGDSGDIIVS